MHLPRGHTLDAGRPRVELEVGGPSRVHSSDLIDSSAAAGMGQCPRIGRWEQERIISESMVGSGRAGDRAAALAERSASGSGRSGRGQMASGRSAQRAVGGCRGLPGAADCPAEAWPLMTIKRASTSLPRGLRLGCTRLGRSADGETSRPSR